jgi:hypothetical protein
MATAQATARRASSSRRTGAPKIARIGVADELVDRALVGEDDLGHGSQIGVQEPHHLVRGQLLRDPGEAAESRP